MPRHGLLLIKNEERRALVEKALGLLLKYFGDNLQSVVAFGSVARGDCRPDSDTDLIVVCRELPQGLSDRMEHLSRILTQLDKTEISKSLRKKGVNTWIQFHALNLEEAKKHRPIYLDAVEDAVILFDKEGFIEKVFSGLEKRLEELGARRVFLKDGSWYWDLKPGIRRGEVVEI